MTDTDGGGGGVVGEGEEGGVVAWGGCGGGFWVVMRFLVFGMVAWMSGFGVAG